MDKIIETEFKDGIRHIIRGIAKEELEKKDVEEIVEEILRSLGQP